MVEKSVKLGKAVPDFSGISTSGTFKLSQYKGKNLVLYFYPKDDTPGCTLSAGDFRDNLAQFQSENTEIVGLSRDSIASHKKFMEKFGLNFPLISDEDGAICDLFQVMRTKKMYGKDVRGISRSTFLIDSSGVLVKEWRDVKVPGHTDEVFEAVKLLNSKSS